MKKSLKARLVVLVCMVALALSSMACNDTANGDWLENGGKRDNGAVTVWYILQDAANGK